MRSPPRSALQWQVNPTVSGVLLALCFLPIADLQGELRLGKCHVSEINAHQLRSPEVAQMLVRRKAAAETGTIPVGAVAGLQQGRDRAGHYLVAQ